jgi:glucose-1-phosphate adenylyltransferase
VAGWLIDDTRILAIVLAGGAGGRMGALTERRAKPALPFGGLYRLIDFPLSNCANSGIDDVWVIQQYQPHSLEDHLANGRPWDLDRTSGGLLILHPFSGGEGEGMHEGNAVSIAAGLAFVWTISVPAVCSTNGRKTRRCGRSPSASY